MSTTKNAKPIVVKEEFDVKESSSPLKKLYSFCDPYRQSSSDEEDTTSVASSEAPSEEGVSVTMATDKKTTGQSYGLNHSPAEQADDYSTEDKPATTTPSKKVQMRKILPVPRSKEEVHSTTREIVISRGLITEKPKSSHAWRKRASKVKTSIREFELGVTTDTQADQDCETSKEGAPAKQMGAKMRIASVFAICVVTIVALLVAVHDSGGAVENVEIHLIKQKEWMTIELKKIKSKLRSEQQNCLTYFSGEKVDTGSCLEYAQKQFLNHKDWIAMKLREMKIKLGEEQHNCMSFLEGEGVNTGCSLEYVPNVLIKLKDWIQLKEWTSLKLKEIENELKEEECVHQKEDVTETESEEQVPEVIVHAKDAHEEM
jgi:hypothetical protein